MAKLKNGILGKLSGVIGDNRCVVRNGKNYFYSRYKRKTSDGIATPYSRERRKWLGRHSLSFIYYLNVVTVLPPGSREKEETAFVNLLMRLENYSVSGPWSKFIDSPVYSNYFIPTTYFFSGSNSTLTVYFHQNYWPLVDCQYRIVVLNPDGTWNTGWAMQQPNDQWSRVIPVNVVQKGLYIVLFQMQYVYENWQYQLGGSCYYATFWIP